MMRLAHLAVLMVLGSVGACVSTGSLTGGGGDAIDAGNEGSSAVDATSDVGAMIDGAVTDAAGREDADADAAITIPPDLVVWLRMEEMSGSTAANTARPSLVATIGGGVTLGGAGKSGRGFSFSGGSGLSIPDPGAGSPLDFNDALTIEFWMKPDTADRACGLVSKETNGTPLTGYTIFQNSSGGYFVFDLRADSRVEPVAPGGALVAGTWVHVAATYDAGVAKLYKNGQFLAVANTTGPIKANDQALSVGSSNYGSYAGMLDEVKIWKVFRTEAEICADLGGTGSGSGCLVAP